MPGTAARQPTSSPLVAYLEGLKYGGRRLPPRARRRIERLERIWEERPGLLGWLTTVDHKRIGLLYFFTTLVVLRARAASRRSLMRTQLAGPNAQRRSARRPTTS